MATGKPFEWTLAHAGAAVVLLCMGLLVLAGWLIGGSIGAGVALVFVALALATIGVAAIVADES